MNFHRNIGHVQYAAAVTVDVEGGTLYTSDWAAFLAAEAKVKDEFEGNVLDLGSKYSPQELSARLKWRRTTEKWRRNGGHFSSVSRWYPMARALGIFPTGGLTAN
ncbi:hypothetical protein EW145_g4506 [Phellinidium pouzarii]|uniref:Uncharacterized protein n=1 Tax=Phellinidium pouzarii TaxID=167371 RepID=A0A4S4L3S6_9AGAM|nr:hypothetical protein EW145_g4506 [Phellinidium pouzarii]